MLCKLILKHNSEKRSLNGYTIYALVILHPEYIGENHIVKCGMHPCEIMMWEAPGLRPLKQHRLLPWLWVAYQSQIVRQ